MGDAGKRIHKVDELTDSSTGTANLTVVAISGSGDDGPINDNFADLTTQLNDLLVKLKDSGLMEV